MPSAFQCPRCQKWNAGRTNVPGTGEYFSVRCEYCREDLAWVADRSAIGWVTRQANVPPTHIAVGHRDQSQVPYHQPTTPDDRTTRIQGRLAQYATLQDLHNQGVRLSRLLPDQTDIEEGICNGLSLYWIRRVLQGGRTNLSIRSEKGGKTRTEVDKHNKMSWQLQKAAHTQRLATETANAEAKALRARVNKAFDAQLTSWGCTKTVNGDQITWSGVTNGEAYRALQAKRDEALAIIDSSGNYGVAWTKISKMITFEGNKRPYSNVTCIQSHHREDYSSVDSFIARVCGDREFRVRYLTSPPRRISTCALLSVGLRRATGEAGGTISGHAVAVYYESAGSLFLFDPNIGVFSCTSLTDLENALRILIGTAWTQDLGWTLDGQFGYSLFRLRAEGDLDTDQRVVNFTDSALGTWVDNLNAGVYKR